MGRGGPPRHRQGASTHDDPNSGEPVVNWIVTGLLTVLCLWMLVAAGTDRGKLYEFPFLAAAITFGFILPQLPGLAIDPFLPAGLYSKTVGFTVVCLAMCRLGWMPNRQPVMRAFQWRLDEKRLLLVALVLSAIGAVFYYKLSRIPVEVAVTTQFSGSNVVFFFFSRLLPYGLCIALLCFCNRPSWKAAVIILFDVVLYLERIMVTGKRAETTELVMYFALAVWFTWRRAIPHSLVLVAVLAGTLLMSSTGDYRQMNAKNDGGTGMAKLEDISIWDNFEKLLAYGGDEMRNAMYRINLVDRNQSFDFGAFHWDTLVWNYIPAQLVGTDVKDAFMIGIEDQFDRYYFFNKVPGTTETGMTDAYASFWYFGALKFFIIAYLMSRLYGAAMAGHAVPQLFYMLLAVPAMHAISHYTQWVLSTWVHVAVFLIPGLLFARIRRQPAPHLAVAAIGKAS
jgi:hypothetical protein